MRTPPSLPDPPEFLIDRSLGQVALARTLRNRGFIVHTLIDLYGVGGMFVDDEVWIVEASEQNWVRLTKDLSVRYVPAQREAIRRTGARVFCLGPRKLAGPAQVACFIDNLDAIVRMSALPGPFIRKVYEDRVEPWWP